MASQGNYTKHIMSFYMLFSKYFKNSGGKNTPKFILQVHHYPETRTRQRHYDRRRLQANIFDEYRCKNPQENISKTKSNNTFLRRGGGNHTPWIKLDFILRPEHP